MTASLKPGPNADRWAGFPRTKPQASRSASTCNRGFGSKSDRSWHRTLRRSPHNSNNGRRSMDETPILVDVQVGYRVVTINRPARLRSEEHTSELQSYS